MKLTLQEVLNSLQALNQLGEEKLPARLSFTIARVTSKLQVDARLFEKERQKLVTKYGERINDNQTKVSSKKAPAFNEEMNVLLETEIGLDGIGHISMSVLDDVEECPKCGEKRPIEIKPNILVPLQWLFVEDDNAP